MWSVLIRGQASQATASPFGTMFDAGASAAPVVLAPGGGGGVAVSAFDGLLQAPATTGAFPYNPSCANRKCRKISVVHGF